MTYTVALGAVLLLLLFLIVVLPRLIGGVVDGSGSRQNKRHPAQYMRVTH